MDNDLKNRTLPELEKLVTDFQGKKYLAKYIASESESDDTSDSNVESISDAISTKLK